MIFRRNKIKEDKKRTCQKNNKKDQIFLSIANMVEINQGKLDKLSEEKQKEIELFKKENLQRILSIATNAFSKTPYKKYGIKISIYQCYERFMIEKPGEILEPSNRESNYIDEYVYAPQLYFNLVTIGPNDLKNLFGVDGERIQCIHFEGLNKFCIYIDLESKNINDKGI